MIVVEDIIYNEITDEYLYLDQLGESHVIYFNEYYIKTELNNNTNLMNKLYYDQQTQDILISSYMTSKNNIRNQIKVYSKQLIEQTDKYFEFDTGEYYLQDLTPIGYDNFIVLNQDGLDYLVATYKWVKNRDNQIFDIVASQHSLVLFQYSTRKFLSIQLAPHTSDIIFLLKGADNQIITASSDNSIKVWKLDSLQLYKELPKQISQINDLIFDEEENILIVCLQKQLLIFYDLRTLQIITQYNKFENNCEKIALGLFRQNFVATEQDGKITIFNYKTRLPIQYLNAQATQYNFVYLYPFYTKAEYKKLVQNASQKDYENFESTKRLITGSNSGKIFVYSWRKTNLQQTDNPQQYLKELQQGIKEKFEYSLQYSLQLASSIKTIEIDNQLNLLIACSKEDLLIVRYSDGEEIQRIDISEINNHSQTYSPNNSQNMNASCQKIVVIHEYMQLFVHTNQKILVYNLAYIMNGPHLYKLANQYQDRFELIKPLNQVFSAYLFRSQQSQLSVIDQTSHNIFVIFQGFDETKVQDFHIFFDNIILVKCSQLKILLFKYNQSNYTLEKLSQSSTLSFKIKKVQNIQQSIYYPHLFYIINVPSQLIVLKFQKDTSTPQQILFEVKEQSAEQKNQIKDVLIISRQLIAIAYFNGDTSLCNPQITFCYKIYGTVYGDFINGFAINPLNNNLIFLYSNSGQISLFQINYSQPYFSQSENGFENSNQCQSLGNIGIPNLISKPSYNEQYRSALQNFIEKEYAKLYPDKQTLPDEIDFLNEKLNFDVTLIQQNKDLNLKIYGFHIFQNINRFITLAFQEGLIYIWDLKKFELLTSLQIPRLSFNFHIKACNLLNTFILSSYMKISIYEYDDTLKIFKLKNSYTTVDDPIESPDINFLNYFSDFQIILGQNSYKILNLQYDKSLIQEIKIQQPVIVSIKMKTDAPINNTISLSIFGFSKNELFWHDINLKQMNQCVLQLNNYSLNEIQNELTYIERNQQVSNHKISTFIVILQISDIYSILSNVPNFIYANSSSIQIIGNNITSGQPVQNIIPSISVKQNWKQFTLQNIGFNSILNKKSLIQFNGDASNKFNELYLINIKFLQFSQPINIEVQNYKIVQVNDLTINEYIFKNQSLLKIKGCEQIQISNITIQKIEATSFIFVHILGSFTSNSFLKFDLQNLQIQNSTLKDTNLFYLQFGDQVNVKNISIATIIGQNSKIFSMQGIFNSLIEKSSLNQTSGVLFLNSSRVVAINDEIYSSFKVYNSNIVLKNINISDLIIDNSINYIFSFYQQNVNITYLIVNSIQGQDPPTPQLLQIPYYNPQVSAQQLNLRQLQQFKTINHDIHSNLRIIQDGQDSPYSKLYSSEPMITVIKALEIISYLDIQNSTFTNIKNTNHVIYSQESSLIKIKQSSFSNIGDLNATNGIIFLERTQISLKYVTFQDNISSKCTNLLQLDSFISNKTLSKNVISNCVFKSNKAAIVGGAMCYVSSLLDIQDSQFINNTAQFGGSIFYLPINVNQQGQTYTRSKNIVDYLSNVTFIENKANLFGINFASGLSYMKALNLPFDGLYFVIENFRSGDSLGKLKVQFYDEENRIIQNDDQNSLNFKFRPIKSQNVQVINSSDFEYNDSILSNDKIRLFGQPGKDGFLYYSSDFIDKSLNKTFKADEQQFRKCIQGEIMRLEYEDENKYKYYSCFECPEGKYSLYNPEIDPKYVKMCQLCPIDKATFCEKNTIQVKNGYWRENNSTDLILYCMNNPDACLGNDICEEGHTGPLCEDCDIQGIIWNKKYTRINNEVFSCIQCENNFAQIAIMFLLQVAITGYLVWSIKKGLDRSKQIVMADLMRKLTLVSLGRSSQMNSTSAFIKIIAHYVQVISSLKYYHPQYPSFGLLYVDYIGDPIDKATFAFDCILIDFTYLGIPFEYLIIIWSQLYQIIYLLIYLAVYYCLIKTKRVEYRQYAIRNAIIFFILFIQNSIVSQLVSVLTCRQIGQKSYIRFAISKECYTDEFYSYSFKLVLPLLLIWVLVIPSIGFYLMFRIRKKLFTFFNTLNYGLIYLEYKPKLFYWEFIRMVKKIILIFIINYFYQNVYYQGIFSLLLVLIYTKILKRLTPYKENYFNRLELKSSLVQIIFFFLVLIQAGMEIQKQSFLSWIIVIMNLIFLVYLIYLCISYQMTLQQIYLMIYKVPCLRKCVEKKIPLQPRIFNSQQLWRSLSIYVRDFIDRRKLDKKAEFYVQHLQIGNNQDNYRVSQLKTSQQFKNIQKQSTLQSSIIMGDKKENEIKEDISIRLNKLQLNEIVTESRVITRIDAISEENQEEDHEVQSEKNFDQIPQQQNEIIIPDFYPNQTKLQIEQTQNDFKTEILDTHGDDHRMQTLQTEKSLIYKDIKQQESFINNSSQPSIVSPQSMMFNNSNFQLIKNNLNPSISHKEEEDDDQDQIPDAPRQFIINRNNAKLRYQQKNTEEIKEVDRNINWMNNNQYLQQAEDPKLTASLFTPRQNENQTQNQVQTARVNFAEKMKKTIEYRSAQKQ